jgi:puromycin-sensitive aminopeptidase
MSATVENRRAYRLPTNVKPLRYDIELDARVGRPNFEGKVSIEVEVLESTPRIEMHAHELLKLNRASVSVGGRTFEGRIEQDAVAEMAAVEFVESVPEGRATLRIEFDGHISPTMEGLYLAQDGPERCLTTQCEETDCRKIFPCWDEPTFKAQFAWTITTDAENTVVLANGPLREVRDSADGKSKTWTFAATKPMSSYLCALVIGDMAGTPEEVVNGTPIRVWALRGKEEMGRFAHEYTTKLIPWYEHYFQAPYHFDKYDQVAVPGFAAGAMENSGLVIYLQSALIMNPKTASWNAEKRIAHVVAHETAHMWFGNLVTMAWWDDLWLNEAFAEWISTKAVDELSPDYKAWNDFQFSKNAAMADDALESTHPIYSKVETPEQATELFDNITYRKGCAVMRMIETYLGEEQFRAGMRTYMQEFAESNATGADLWRHLAQASGEPVDAIMQTWITQGGYPVLDVALEGNTLSLKQLRFYTNPGAKRVEQLWQVPVVLRYEDGRGTREHRLLLTEESAKVEIPVEGEVKWLYANADEVGFYRQALGGELLDRVLANVDRLTTAEQMGLLNDLWAQVRSGKQNIGRFLDVLSALTVSTDYSVLAAVVGRMHGVELLLEEAGDEAALARFRQWVKEKLQGQLEEVGFEPRKGESQEEGQRRVAVIDAMATLAQDSPEKVLEWADREAADPASVDANLSGLFVAAAAQRGDRARFDRYLEIYKARKQASASPQETDRYLYSLAEFRDPALVGLMPGMLADGTIPQEAIGRMLRLQLAMPHAREIAWGFMKNNWPTIRNLGDMWTGHLVEATGNLPARLRDEMVRFYDEHLQGVAQKPLARALEMQDQLTEFKARTRDDLVGWFKSH